MSEKIDTSTEAVTALLKGVSAGPWRIHNIKYSGDRCTNYIQEIWNDELDILVAAEVTSAHNDGGAANMRFIRAARDLVPALAAEKAAITAEVERLTRERDCLTALRDQLASARDAVIAKWVKCADERDALRAEVERLRIAAHFVEKHLKEHGFQEDGPMRSSLREAMKGGAA